MDGTDSGPEVHALATPTTPPAVFPPAGELAQQGQQGQHLHPPTLDQIANVIRKEVQPIRNTINSLERRFNEMSGAIVTRIEEVEENVEDIAIRLSNLENQSTERSDATATPRSDDAAIWDQIKSLEAQVSELKVTGKQQHEKQSNISGEAKRDITAVIGKLVGFDSLSAASTWVTDTLSSLSAPKAIDIYSKGDFRDILFAVFASEADRDLAVGLLRSASPDHRGTTIWVTQDKSPSFRAARNVCFGLKRILNNELNNKYTIQIATNEFPFLVSVGGVTALSVGVDGSHLALKWHPDWEIWEELQKHPKLTEVIAKNTTLLERTSEGMKGTAKGGSKGK